jgi:DNA polymerase-1
MAEFKKKLLMVDGHALLYRAYHALPNLTNSQGFPTGAIFGFFSMFLKALEDLKPTHVLVTFDVRGPTFRDKLSGDYKAHRKPTPDDLNLQLPKIKEVLQALCIPVYEKAGFEADDLLGIISRRTGNDVQNIIATGDMDLLQLINDNTVVYRFKKGFTDVVIYNQARMKQEFGLTADQWVDLKALKGDASDNIPGVPGVGEKTALDLIQRYGTLDKLYKAVHKKDKNIKAGVLFKLEAGEHYAELSKKLANIDTSYKLDFEFQDCQLSDYDMQKVLELFTDLSIKSLIPKLPKLSAKAQAEVEAVVPKVTKQTSKLILNEAQAELAAYLLNPGRRDYAIEVAADWNVLEIALKEKKLLDIYQKIELPLMEVLSDMTKIGVKLDLDWLSRMNKKLETQIEKITKEIHQHAGGEFNISSPKQLQEILFQKLRISTENLKKNKKSGGISTAAGELEKMRGLHPIIDLIFEYRELTKLKSTYVDALPLLVSPTDHRVHTTYSQTTAATGRLSSNNPNLQNIPIRTELGREVRKAFIAETGFKLASIDYSQIELRIAASLSNDSEMIKIFKSAKDFHKATAARIFNCMESQVTAEQRRDAKTINFSVLYGVSAFGLSSRSMMGHAEAADFIKRYYQVFAGLKKYIDNQIKQVHEKGYTTNLLGRIRYYPEINSPNFAIRGAAERQAVNAPIQSLQADIIKMAMIEIAKSVTEKDCRMLLQVHDELVFEIKEDKLKDCIPKIKDIMESAFKLKVPIVADAKLGDNWNEMEKFK